MAEYKYLIQRKNLICNKVNVRRWSRVRNWPLLHLWGQKNNALLRVLIATNYSFSAFVEYIHIYIFLAGLRFIFCFFLFYILISSYSLIAHVQKSHIKSKSTKLSDIHFFKKLFRKILLSLFSYEQISYMTRNNLKYVRFFFKWKASESLVGLVNLLLLSVEYMQKAILKFDQAVTTQIDVLFKLESKAFCNINSGIW